MSIVLQLQSECLDKDKDLQSLLRKALVISTKLKLLDFKEWINNELKGFKENTSIPEYRIVPQKLKFFNPYHSWISAQLSPEIEEEIGKVSLPQSITELEYLLLTADETLSISPSASQARILRKTFATDFEAAFFLSKTSVHGIVETVRSLLLEWTLKLEEDGIIGDENMIFTTEEKQSAQNINIHQFSGILGDITNTGNVSTGNDTSNIYNQQLINEEVDKLIEKIETSDIENKEDMIINLNAIKEDKIALTKVLGGLLTKGSEIATLNPFILNILSKLGL